MKCRDIMRVLERIAPVSWAESWDNVGLLLGREERNVSRILVTLDVTEEVVEQAVADQVDMIVSHHPLIFHGLKQISDHTAEGKKILRLAGHDISYYAMHTNYDVSGQGMAVAAAARLGMKDLELLKREQTVVMDGSARDIGAGRVGRLSEPVTLQNFCSQVKNTFGLKTLRVWGKFPREELLERAAILPGSGEDYLEAAMESGAQVFLTGDIKYHRGMDAAERGLVILDCGHFGLEHIFTEEMERYPNSQLSSNIEILISEGKNPYTVV